MTATQMFVRLPVFLGSALLCLSLSGTALAESRSFEITVAAGAQDRSDTPVCVRLPVPRSLEKAEAVSVQDEEGQAIPAQLTGLGLLSQPLPGEGIVTRELHFILPSLKAGATLNLKAIVTADPPAKSESFSWKDTPGESMELRFGSKPVLRYMYQALDDSSKEKREATYKVFHHLFDPAGERLVTKGAGGLYTHHRGLFFGFNRITYGAGEKADIWHCTNDTHQSHEKLLASAAGPVLGQHRLEIAWRGKDKKVFAVEERELTVYHVPGGRLVEFASRLTSAGGKVKLDGDPQHAGFQFRASQEVADWSSKKTYYLRPDGPGKPGEMRNWNVRDKTQNQKTCNLPWNALCFVLADQRYTVGYLDRPANPKEARFSERDYGRFGSYFEYELADDKPLEIDYRIWLQKGEMTVKQMADRSADFVEPVKVRVK